jgi:hypothetical protein
VAGRHLLVLALCFFTFLPGAIHRQGILNMMVFDAALRARWAHQLLGNHPV